MMTDVWHIVFIGSINALLMRNAIFADDDICRTSSSLCCDSDFFKQDLQAICYPLKELLTLLEVICCSWRAHQEMMKKCWSPEGFFLVRSHLLFLKGLLLRIRRSGYWNWRRSSSFSCLGDSRGPRKLLSTCQLRWWNRHGWAHPKVSIFIGWVSSTLVIGWRYMSFHLASSLVL